MAYTSLYRRYRPQRFAELIGQPHVVAALRNAVREGRVGHAYLFSGPRGTGKTSTARILAKALNCTDLQDGEPCGACESCRAVVEGRSLDVFELDAASNRGIDQMRDLVTNAALGSPGRTKVYVLDEVHMLTKEASNTLLKTLEEPPEHVVFVLATTDPQKVLPTIRSRTQHLEFRLLPQAELDAHVRAVAADAGIDVTDEGVAWAVRAGRGSVRDTLSALERVVAQGAAPDDAAPLDDLVDALTDQDTGAALAAVTRAVAAGLDARTLAEALVAHLRDLFLAQLAPDVLAAPPDAVARDAERGARLGLARTVRAIEVLGDVLLEIRHAPDPRVLVDVAMVRLTRPEADTGQAALVARIERLEHLVSAGPAAPDRSVAPSSTPAAATPADSGAPAAPPRAPAAPSTATSGGPAQARAALGAVRRARSDPAPPSPRSVPPAPASAPPPPAAASTPQPAGAAAPVGPSEGGATPTRDQLTLAWADAVLTAVPPKVKALYSAGRFIDTPDGIAFALPNAVHCEKAEPYRTDVEGALAAHFGVPVGMRLVVDTGVARAARTTAPDDPPVEDDEPVDPHELEDAPADAAPPSGIERLTEVFPGAELVEER